MMKRTSCLQQSELGDSASAVTRAATQALAAQRMSEFLDNLPHEPADPSAPPLTQKDINALIGHVEKRK